MDESLFTSLRDIFEAIIKNQSRTGVVSPHRFLEILRRDNEMFRSAMHQDAHEFLNLLLNSVVDNVEMFAKQYPGLTAAPHANGGVKGMAMAKSVESNAAASTLDTHWVHDLFEGLLTSETRCLTCENTSQRDEAFLDLSVDLSPHTSVTSCLRKFSEEEMLCERNKFHCDNCGGLQEAEKRMKIKRLPQILALHLKRFKYTEDLQRLQKLFHRVVYPFYLRLFNTTDDAEDSDRLYELYSVVVHIGGGPYHGHYVSIVKTEDRGWLLFDDELVEPVSKDYVQQFFGGEPVPGAQDAKQLACAYVLFYQETTMEKMLKEQEMEGQPTTQVPTRVSETDTAREHATSPIRTNGLHHVTTNVQTPMPEEYTHHMDPLAHAQTAPNTIHTMMYDGPPPTPVLPTKSKKELKQEEKERKAAEKVAQKEREARYRDAAMRRMETLKKAEEDMKVVLEQSKQTAAAEALARAHEEEAKRNAHHPHPQQLQEERKTHSSSPFARLSRRSISLRKKPSIFDKKSRTESTSNGNALPPLPQGASASTANHSQYPNRNQTRTPVSNPHSHQRHESSPAASGVGNGSTTPTGRRRDEFERGPFAPPLDEAEGNNGDGGDAVGNHQQEQPQSQHGHAHHHSYHDFVPSVPRRVLTTHHHGSGPGQEKGKKNRFSLGRKKSALI
jgi:ubiquitin carboxyl-terminal hydrolase 9/13